MSLVYSLSLAMKTGFYFGVAAVLLVVAVTLLLKWASLSDPYSTTEDALAPRDASDAKGDKLETGLPIRSSNSPPISGDRKSVLAETDAGGAAVIATALSQKQIPSDVSLEQKYAHLSGREFVGAYKGFRLYYSDCADSLLQDKMDRGDYVSRIVEVGEAIGSSVKRSAWPGEYPPAEKMKFISLGDGVQEVQTAHIFPSDDPILSVLIVEQEWLRKKALPFTK